MIKQSIVIAVLLSALVPYTAYGDTVCVEWSQEETILRNVKANWNGEVLTVRYYNDTGSTIESAIVLTYDQTKKIRPSINDLLMANIRGGVQPNTWASSSFQLPYRPTSYYISFTESKCIKRRDKTWLEKMRSL
jgi:hypothetical protein